MPHQPDPQKLHDTIFEFNTLCAPKPVVSLLRFRSALEGIATAIVCALPENDPISKFLRTTPLWPMSDKEYWNGNFALIHNATKPEDRYIEVRPDLVSTPVFFAKVIAQQVHHITSSDLDQLSKIRQKLTKQNPVSLDFPKLLYDYRSLNVAAQMNATESEIRVLSAISCPDGLLQEQRDYFNEQVKANIAVSELHRFTLNAERTCLDVFFHFAIAPGDGGAKMSDAEFSALHNLFEASQHAFYPQEEWAHRLQKITASLGKLILADPAFKSEQKRLVKQFASWDREFTAAIDGIRAVYDTACKQKRPPDDVLPDDDL